MFFTINRLLFAVMLGLIGLDLLTERLTNWFLPMHWAGQGEDWSCLFLALAYFLAMIGVLTLLKSGAAADFWRIMLKSCPNLKIVLSVSLSVLQVSLWVQVASVIKSGHTSGLDGFELSSITILHKSLPFLLLVAIPIVWALRKWRDSFVNKMVAQWNATISDSSDPIVLFDHLNRLVVFERYRKNWEMADLHSRRLLALVEERTHKVKRMSRPKMRQAQLRKCG